MTSLDDKIVEFSEFIDSTMPEKTAEELLWQRTAKIGEEFGEVIEAVIRFTAGNFRKISVDGVQEIQAELMDVASCALFAYAHVSRGGDAFPMQALEEKINFVFARAGLSSHE